jgi:hypothetical protein
MKIVKYFLFIPISILAFSIIYGGVWELLSWFFELSTFWLIVVFIFFGGLIWSFFKGLSSLLIYFVSFLSPNKTFGFWTMLILSLINGVWTIYNSWTLDINYSGTMIFGAVVFTTLVLEITFALILASVTAAADENL